eukprot:Tamp_23947.p1 GENE.Tamp_23947~~Tamp_23947.p1  ORF type:complete len:325 (+),score=30.79 Tamp_23947:95-976(+)
MEVLEMADERKTIRRYLVIGIIIMFIVGLACYDLWMRVERQFYSQGLRTNGLPKSDRGAAGVAAGGGGGILGTMFRTHVHVTPPVSRGPAPDIAVTGSSRMPSSAEHSQLRLAAKHLMIDPAIMEAQSLLWKQVEDWARAHSKEAVKEGMTLILETEAAKYKKIVTSLVLDKLVSTSNSVAAHINEQLCPRTKCSRAVEDVIKDTARWVSTNAVDSAFKDLRASVFDHRAMEQSGLDRQGRLTNPGHVGARPAAHTGPHDVVVQPAAFEKAAESGMGYQPAGFVAPSAAWTGH